MESQKRRKRRRRAICWGRQSLSRRPQLFQQSSEGVPEGGQRARGLRAQSLLQPSPRTTTDRQSSSRVPLKMTDKESSSRVPTPKTRTCGSLFHPLPHGPYAIADIQPPLVGLANERPVRLERNTMEQSLLRQPGAGSCPLLRGCRKYIGILTPESLACTAFLSVSPFFRGGKSTLDSSHADSARFLPHYWVMRRPCEYHDNRNTASAPRRVPGTAECLGVRLKDRNTYKN